MRISTQLAKYRANFANTLKSSTPWKSGKEAGEIAVSPCFNPLTSAISLLTLLPDK